MALLPGAPSEEAAAAATCPLQRTVSDRGAAAVLPSDAVGRHGR